MYLKKQVWIKIKSTQSEGSRYDETEVCTKGLFYKKNNIYYIIYKETDDTGFDGCTSIIKIKSDKIYILRQGNAKSNMIIEKNQRNVGYYSTPIGGLVIGVNAKDLEINLNGDGGRVYFSYSLDINAQFISDNTVAIEVSTLDSVEI